MTDRIEKTIDIRAPVARVWRAPGGGDELLWWEDEAEVEGDESDLLDDLEAKGYEGAKCAVIMDASAWWQDGAHTQGKTSDRAFRARGWTHLYRPQKDSLRNPDILERMRSGNALLKAKSGRRRMFVARTCVRTAENFRRYEKLHGKPNRRSEHAHGIDCCTYVTYRLYGVPKLVTTAKVIPLERFNRRAELRAGP